MNRLEAALALLVFLASPAWGEEPRRGDFKDDWKDQKTGALAMHYRMRTPDTLPQKKTLGLIVAFHGLHSNENDLTGFVIAAAQRIGVADQYIIMGGKSKGEGWEVADDKDVLAWILWVRETYPIDPRRIHILGMSNGGGMVKRFGWANQDLFASISPYCGVSAEFSGGQKTGKPPPAKGPMSPAETRTEWYFVHGNADKTVAADASRRAVKQLALKGYRCIYREIEGADHTGILGYAEVADDNLRFIHALRNKGIQPSKDERAEVASIAGKLKSEKAAAALPLIDQAARMGGSAAAPAMKSALANPDAAVKTAAIAATENVLFNREIVLELIKLTKDKTPEVKSAAFKALGTLANWRFPEAVDHLVQTARKRPLPVEDRVAAIQGLGKALKLMLLGWYEDRSVPWTLVLLLDDPEAKVREAAFAPLAAGVKDVFGYKPDLGAPERKAPVAKWMSWCEKQAGPPGGPGAAK